MVLPFSVFLRGNRPYYYVAFKNEETGRYLPAISTKKTTEAAAIKQAWVWFREGIPRKGGPLDIKAASLRDTIRHAIISPSDAEFIISDLKRRGLILSCVFSGAPDTLKRIKIIERPGEREEVYICWEDGSKRRVKIAGEGYEIQGLLIAIERKPGKR